MNKEKFTKAIGWSFIEGLANQGITFIFGIILARLVAPYEFGLIAIVSIIIAIAQTIVDSGFSQALIRKKNCTSLDYATVFVYNLALAVIIYCALFFFAEWISVFFGEKKLTFLIKIAGIGLVINAFSLVQRTALVKKMNFRLQAKTAFLGSFISGIIAIILAFYGYGLLSLLVNIFLSLIINAILISVLGPWKVSLAFDWITFKQLQSFASNLLLAGLIDNLYKNAINFIIGKFFSSTTLGYYNTADQFQSLPSQNISGVIQKVSYPFLSTLQDDQVKFKLAYKRIIGCTMLISFVFMFGMAASAKNLLIVLIGEQWMSSVQYLQLLCFVGMFYPLHALNLNILKVKGRSDLFLRLEVIKKTLVVPIILLGIFYGIKMMIIGMIIASLLSYHLNGYWSGKLINYPLKEQIKDILPAFMVSSFMSAIVYAIGGVLNVTELSGLLIQLLVGICITICLCILFRIEDFLYIKRIVFDKINRLNFYGAIK